MVLLARPCSSTVKSCSSSRKIESALACGGTLAAIFSSEFASSLNGSDSWARSCPLEYEQRRLSQNTDRAIRRHEVASLLIFIRRLGAAHLYPNRLWIS